MQPHRKGIPHFKLIRMYHSSILYAMIMIVAAEREEEAVGENSDSPQRKGLTRVARFSKIELIQLPHINKDKCVKKTNKNNLKQNFPVSHEIAR